MTDALTAIEQISLAAHDGEKSELLIGPQVTLADIALMPIAAYLTMTPEGQKAIAASRRLSRWWLSVSRRPSLARSWRVWVSGQQRREPQRQDQRADRRQYADPKHRQHRMRHIPPEAVRR